MRKLILKSFLSPGDIVMMTAAVRDLHLCYPRRFKTDVRTSCAELWENNPYVTPLNESDPNVEVIKCAYPLINRCNDQPYHCLHGYIDFLNSRLKLAIKPAAFRGDIHLSALEKSWYSQVHELTRSDIPFWIVAAGGKYDVTIKWWSTERYQKVVDHFRGRIQFVQIGDYGHHHPPLDGVIDLRGQTNLRELVRLVYHSQGVLCPVTAIMHLAAAVESKHQPNGTRPCVVIAGGREPAHWEAYPGHQYLHTNGALRCCSTGGCWRDRTRPLYDGDHRDGPENLCVDVVRELPRCMDMITAEQVIQRIEMYFTGGSIQFLNSRQAKAAKRAVLGTKANGYDNQPLTLQSARAACESFIRSIPISPPHFNGRGIVICGGGVQYFPCAWVCINMLRHHGCSLPIQLWHLGPDEMSPAMRALLKPLGVQCVDALAVRKKRPVRMLGGWELKAYAILNSPFRETLLLDADNVPVKNPEFLFESHAFKKSGAVFWSDYGQFKKTQTIWDNCGLDRPSGPEFETGQVLVDKSRCWRALSLAMWFNEHSDFYYQHLHGDKETFHIAFRKLGTSFAMPSTPIHSLTRTMCQHDFEGERIFQHRNTDKWNLFLHNKEVEDFRYEPECRAFLRRLQELWDGGAGDYVSRGSMLRRSVSGEGLLDIAICMITCPERARLRERTVRSLQCSDWPNPRIYFEVDHGGAKSAQERQAGIARSALHRVLTATRSDYILFLEDDLEFNRFFYYNLTNWPPLVERRVTLGGLYNPGLKMVACDVPRQAVIVRPDAIFGSQAFLLSRAAAAYVVKHWEEVDGMQDIKISRLAGKLGQPIWYHVPSLVQHTGRKSVWGGQFHLAQDYDAGWRCCQNQSGPVRFRLSTTRLESIAKDSRWE